MFEVQVRNNLQDHVKATRFYMLRQRAFVTFLPALLFAAAGGVLLALGKTEGLVLLVAAAVIPFITVYFAMSTARKRADNPAFLSGSAVYRFDAEGVMCVSSSEGRQTAQKTLYGDIFKVCETREFFFLFLKKDTLRALPKRGVVRGDAQGLSELLRTKLGSRKKGK